MFFVPGTTLVTDVKLPKKPTEITNKNQINQPKTNNNKKPKRAKNND